MPEKQNLHTRGSAMVPLCFCNGHSLFLRWRLSVSAMAPLCFCFCHGAYLFLQLCLSVFAMVPVCFCNGAFHIHVCVTKTTRRNLIGKTCLKNKTLQKPPEANLSKKRASGHLKTSTHVAQGLDFSV